ncbi:MAG TPA: hypothetical protein VFK38_02090 [Candidatus Limnocylindrales bacterium]|nr:hypothetical protein [Candidatus Limnocylindrales bacterium]
MVDEERVVTTHHDEVAPAPAAHAHGETTTAETVVRRVSGAEMARRLVVFIFGVIQALIVLRILLLLLNAREGNALVAFILDLSQIFVAPFEGILRTNALQAGGSVLDVSAIVALVGWTILELIVIALVNVFRREP